MGCPSSRSSRRPSTSLSVEEHSRKSLRGKLATKPNTTKKLRKTISPRSVLRDVVQQYAQAIGLAQEVQGLCTHSLRATGATNALAQQTAAQIGFTLRRWWRERTEPAVLRVEVERRLVGAPPAVAVLTVAIPQPSSSRSPRPAPASSPVRSRPT